MIRRPVTAAQLEAQPHLLWNEFVHLLAFAQLDELSPIQRIPHLAFWYYNEVENGGHLQYFENQGIERGDEVIASLALLGAIRPAEILQAAKERYQSKTRQKIVSVSEFVEQALEAEYDDLDRAYYECEPRIDFYLEMFLKAHEAEFIVSRDPTLHVC